MVSRLFLGLSLLGAEWVLYLLILTSVFSVAIIIERIRFIKKAKLGLDDFRTAVRTKVESGDWQGASKEAEIRKQSAISPDLETELVISIIKDRTAGNATLESQIEAANDPIQRTKVLWEKNLVYLAIIGANAPFVGLFGTVLGIITAFKQLSAADASAITGVMAGIAEALVATAIGLFVAIPAVIAYNMFQRYIRETVTQAESLKSFIIGRSIHH